MYDSFTAWLAQATTSDIFAGGLALGGLGVALATLRALWLRLSGMVGRRVMISLTLDNRSAAYRNFYLWLEATGALAHARQVRVTDVASVGGEVFGPAPGLHWFVRDGRLVLFRRHIDEKARVGAGPSNRAMEVITLTVPFGSIGLIRGWIRDGASFARSRERIGPGLHILRGDWWQSLGDVTGRPLDTVLADDDRVDRLAADVRRFLGARDWYGARGVPWRRGYLLYGPPGTGKSSVIRALATDLRLDIATIDLGRAGLTDDDLREGLFTTPAHALIALEDIDSVFVKRGAGDKATSVSFSGLLNAIDGIAAQEGRALFMTTNHRDKLDHALIRPGRADVHMEFGLIGGAAAARLYLRFFPGDEAGAEVFRAAFGAARKSPAEVQALLLAHADDPLAAQAALGARHLMAAE
jgi:mitochondrial chaperone BCS1